MNCQIECEIPVGLGSARGRESRLVVLEDAVGAKGTSKGVTAGRELLFVRGTTRDFENKVVILVCLVEKFRAALLKREMIVGMLELVDEAPQQDWREFAHRNAVRKALGEPSSGECDFVSAEE
jgi:hypothetical protein